MVHIVNYPINHDDSPILRLGHFQRTPCTPASQEPRQSPAFPGGFHIAFGKHSCAPDVNGAMGKSLNITSSN